LDQNTFLAFYESINLNIAKQTKTDTTGTLKKPCSGTF